MGSNEKIVQVKLREHVNSSVTELASFDIDILAYLMKEKREIEKIRVEESLLSFGGRERYELMDESKLKEPPKIAFAVTLFTSSLDSFYNWLHKRKQALDASAKSISKVIDGLGIKIAQLTRGFKTVSTDESRIFFVAENDEGCWCRSPKGNKKNKKSCIVL